MPLYVDGVEWCLQSRAICFFSDAGDRCVPLAVAGRRGTSGGAPDAVRAILLGCNGADRGAQGQGSAAELL